MWFKFVCLSQTSDMSDAIVIICTRERTVTVYTHPFKPKWPGGEYVCAKHNNTMTQNATKLQWLRS